MEKQIQAPDYQHPKNVIYLDTNAFALITKYAKTQDPSLLKFVTLIDHLRKSNSIPFSIFHLFELMNTGRKSNLSNETIQDLIQKDLKILKYISREETIYFDDKDTCRVMNLCPIDKYEELQLFDGFTEIYYELLELMPKKLISKIQKATGLSSKVLNNHSVDSANTTIQESLENLHNTHTIETIKDDPEYLELIIKQSENTLSLLDKTEEWIFRFINRMLPALSKEEQETVRTGLETFKLQFNDAKELTRKTILDVESGEYIKNLSKFSFQDKTLSSLIDEQLESLKLDNNIAIDKDMIQATQRNLFGYFSKNIKDRNSQASDHHDHMHARFIKHSSFFITANDKEASIFNKRYGHYNRSCKILSANQFIEYMVKNFDIKFTSDLNENEKLN